MKKVKSGYIRIVRKKGMYFWSMLLPLSLRTIWASFAYLMLSLLLVNFANEGGENTPLENLAFRGGWVSLAYYASQVLLMLGYMRFQLLGWGVTLIVVVLVALLRSLSSGVAILTVAMVMGREMVQRASSRD
jgi:hypothetical protein